MVVLALPQLRPEQSQKLAQPRDDFPDDPSLVERRFRKEVQKLLNPFLSRLNAIPDPLARICRRPRAPCPFGHVALPITMNCFEPDSQHTRTTALRKALQVRVEVGPQL